MFGSLLKNSMKIFLKYYSLKQHMTETICRPSMQNMYHNALMDNGDSADCHKLHYCCH